MENQTEELKKEMGTLWQGALRNFNVASAQQPSFSFVDKAKIMKNQALEMSAVLRKKIRGDTATNYEFGMGETVDEAAKMRKQSAQIAEAGVDTAQLDQQINQYESIAKDKIAETRRKSWRQLKTDIRATQSEIAGDTAAFADVQYAAAISRLDEERAAREKAVMQDKNDLVAKQTVEAWYTAQVDLEQQKRNAKHMENQLSRYRSNVEHNKLLLDLENKTLAEIDLLNEQELKSGIYYLDEKLKDAGLAGDTRLAMEKEKKHCN